MSPQDLLAVNTSSEEYNHRNKAGVFYAQSWLTVHYLFMERENGRQNVIEFLQRYSQRAPTEEDFRSVFSIGYADLRRELQRYVKRSTFPYQRLDTSAAKPEAGSFRRLERSEVLAALGELAVPLRPEVARRHFEASLELASDQPRAIAGLAELTASDDQEKAHGLFRQAAESENDDASIHYRYALSMIRSGDSPEQIVSQLRRSVEIDPSYGPAWAQLALTHVSMSSTPEDAIEIALRALNLLPARVDLAFCLMQTYLSKNDFIGAMNVVDQYLSIADDGRHVRRAHQLLAKAELRQAEKFVESGKLDDARSLLDHIDHELRDSLDFLLSRRLDKLKKEVEQ